MAPLADLIVDRRLPIARIDFSAAKAAFELEAARRMRVEAEHPIVRMTPESLDDLEPCTLDAIEHGTDVIDAAHLKEEMMDALLHRASHREAVVARVHVKESDVHLISTKIADDVIAQPETEDLDVEIAALIPVRGGDHEMAEAERIGVESAMNEL